jgi:nucleoid-associated protein YejK
LTALTKERRGLIEDADRGRDQPRRQGPEVDGRRSLSPRLLVVIGLGLLVALGIAAKAGADAASPGAPATPSSTTTDVGTSTSALASSSTTTTGAARTSTSATGTTTIPGRSTTTGTTIVAPSAAAAAAPVDPTVTIASAGDSIYHVTVHILEATPGAHTFTLGTESPPQSNDFSDGESFDFSLNSNTTETLSVTNLPAGWLTSVGGAGCPALGTPFSPAVGTTSCDYTFTEPATIQVVVNTQGGNATFTFTEPVLGPLAVTTSLLRGTSEYDLVPPGTYHLSQVPLPGWTEGPFTGDCAPDGTITIGPGQLGQCVVANAAHANLIIQKVTIPASSTLFTFTSTGNLPTGPFQLANGGTKTFPQVDANMPYTFTEAANPSYTVTASGAGCDFDPATLTVSIFPAVGDTVTCTFTNQLAASITIDKVTQPSGDPTSFDFTADGGLSPASFSLTDAAAPQVFTSVAAGQTYTITEAVPTGWTLVTSGTGCTPTTNGVTVTPAPGDAINCVFTDTGPPSITIQKTAIGGDGTFTITEPTLGSQAITTSGGTGSTTFFDISPGTYTFAEDPVDGWSASDFGGDCSPTGDVTVVAGQNAICTITNTKLATVNISKVTDPSGDPALFDFTAAGTTPASFQLGDGETESFASLVPGGTYSFTEQEAAGWQLAGSGTGCGFDETTRTVTVTPDAGAVLNCTFTNTKLATITIEKTAVGGDAQFTFDEATLGQATVDTAGGVGSVSYLNVPPGSYDLDELSVLGWSAGPFGGDCTSAGVVSVSPGQVATCTITNTKLATISIDKVTAPTGDPTSFSFSATGGLSPSSFSLTDAAAPQVFSDVTPGQAYTVTESVPSGWSLVTSGSGCVATTNGVMITPAPGAAVSCVFTDTKLASITIAKTAAGGDATFTFTEATLGSLSVTTSGGAGSASYVDVAPGTYALGETPLAGWSAGPFGGACTSSGTVVVGAGSDVTCTITNTKLASISIDKVTLPSGDLTSFSFSATGGLSPSSFSLTDVAAPQQFTDVTPGQAYTVTESVPSGWSLVTSGSGCVATINGVTITPTPGQSVSCVFTDTKLASISIDKVTAPSGDPTSFAFTAGGGLSPSSFSLTDAGAPQQFTDVTPGQAYTVTESVPSGWSLVTSGTGCVAATNGVTITPAPGATVSCVFTDTKLATITIAKTAVGGDATFTITEPTLGSQSVTTSGGTGSASFVDVAPGTYALAETPLAGWSAGPFGGACTSSGTVVVSAGANVTCTITNTKLASISIDKVTAPSGDSTSFSFTATGGLTPGSFSLTDASPPRVFSDVTPGQAYTVTESVPSGWSLVTSGTGCVATTNGVTITPSPGQSVNCVFTDTKLASITIAKTTVGGDATFTFTEATLGSRSVTTSGGAGSASYVDVAPGTYALGETPLAGWSAGPFGGACTSSGTVVVGAGANVTCTITNTKLATISVDKVTLPAGDPTSFSFSATGGLTPGSFSLTDASAPQQFTDVTPGQAYTVTESVPSGWSLVTSGTGCVATTNGVTITPTPGQSVSCVFTDTKLATISIDKVTLPAGDPSSFAFSAGGGLSPSSFSLTDASAPQQFSDVTPGQAYTVAESVPSGWSLVTSGTGCVATTNGVTVTPSPGQSVACVFTDTKLATISIDKVTLPSGDPTSFAFTAGGSLSPSSFSLTDASAPQQFSDVTPGQSYTVTESVPSGWSLVTSGTGCVATTNGVTITPTPGQSISCVFTDTKLATITIDKVTLPAGDPTSFAFSAGGGLSPSSFSLTDVATPQQFSDVTPGQSYTVTESVPAGWSLVTSGTGCVATTNGVTITPTPGQSVACVFTDTKLATISIDKVTLPSGDPTSFAFAASGGLSPSSFSLTDASAPQLFSDVTPGQTYTVAEAVPSGWSLVTSGPGCVATTNGMTITPTPGQSVACVFTDTKLATISIDKVTAPAGDPTSFAFSATGGLSPSSFSLTDVAAPQQFSDVTPGQAYTVTESVPSGWSLVTSGTGCVATTNGVTITPTPGEDVSCVFTDTKLATITIDKTALGGDETFVITEATLGDQSITTSGGSGSATYLDVPPGSYTFVETPQLGWAAGPFEGDCDSDGSVTVLAGGTATCGITNTKEASLVIEKHTVPAGDPTTFDFSTTGGLDPASFQLGDGASQGFTVTPGQTYTVTEPATIDWIGGTSGEGCDPITDGVSVTPRPGEQLTCVFTNTKLAPSVTPNPPRVSPGAVVVLALRGFPPNTALTVSIVGADDLVVGVHGPGTGSGPFSVQSDADGDASLPLSLAADSPVGEYQVAVSGAGFTTVGTSFVVVAPATTTTVPACLCVTTTSAPSVAVAAEQVTPNQTGFAFTGSRAADLATLAAVLLACGLGALYAVRRRRRRGDAA